MMAPPLLECGVRRAENFPRRFTEMLLRLSPSAVVAAILWFGTPAPGSSQGISLTGAAEGGAIALPGTSTNLLITATPAAPTGTTNIVFVLERQGSIIINRTSPPPYSVTFSNLTFGKYFLSATLLAPGAPAGGDLSFDITPASLAPANDGWSQAAALSINTTATSSNTYATSELNEPAHGGLAAGKSIWWAWTAESSGLFTATTAGSGFDSVLAVYTGTNVGTLTEVAANDDAGLNSFSQVSFFATNGVVYYFAVDGASAGASGRAQLRLTANPPPAVSVMSPADGALFLVRTPSVATNTQAVVAISDPAGTARVDYWFDGPGMSRSGILSPPYQLSLTNLLEGHYMLTVMASNNVGLVGTTNWGVSVVSLSPVLVTDGFDSGTFLVGVTGFKTPNYALQASSNLEVWCSVRTWTNFPGADNVADTNAASFTRRFYRASSQ
jgi:hypothetical protein